MGRILSHMNFLSAASTFIPAKVAGDLSFLLIFIAASVALAFVLGRTRLIGVVVFSYAAFAISLTIPAPVLSSIPEGRAISFAVSLVVLVAVGDYILDIHISNPMSTFFSRVLVMGCLGAGLAFSIILSLVSKPFALSFLSATVFSYFASPVARLVWMVAPLAFLLFLNKRK